MDLSVEAGGRTLQSKRNSVTRTWKVGEYKVQFDWKLGELWERGDKFCLIPEGLEGPVRIWQLIGKKM